MVSKTPKYSRLPDRVVRLSLINETEGLAFFESVNEELLKLTTILSLRGTKQSHLELKSAIKTQLNLMRFLLRRNDKLHG